MPFLQWHFTMSPNIWKSRWGMCEYESFQENILFCYDGFYFSVCWLVNLFSFYFREAIFVSISWCGQNMPVFLQLHIYRCEKCMHSHIHTLLRQRHGFIFLFIYELYFNIDSKTVSLTYSLPIAGNKSTILKAIEDDSFNAVII